MLGKGLQAVITFLLSSFSALQGEAEVSPALDDAQIRQQTFMEDLLCARTGGSIPAPDPQL